MARTLIFLKKGIIKIIAIVLILYMFVCIRIIRNMELIFRKPLQDVTNRTSLFFGLQRGHHVDMSVLAGDHQAHDQGDPEGQHNG